jgi:putative tryptophan/tyrosine transport system substrate-binding protein
MQFDPKRRELIVFFGGAAALWPLRARAQQADRLRRVGVLMGYSETDPEAQAFLSEFTRGLSELGWTDGRNLRINIYWAPGHLDLMRTFAKEIVGLRPDVILANSTPVTRVMKRETLTIPIVFAGVSDPVGSGFVASLARPGGNITGLSHTEASLASKWLELLRAMVPGLKRAAMMFNPDTAPYTTSYFLPSFETAARLFGVAPAVAPVHNDTEIDTVKTGLGREPGSGLLSMPDNCTTIHRAIIISMAARNNVPAVYQTPDNAREGGLLSYGADFRELFHRAAAYVDKILRGASPSQLPVQMPTKFIMVVNLKTAKALGITVPPSILATADEVIE